MDVASGKKLATIQQTLDVDASDLRAELPIKLNSQFVVMLTCRDKQTVFVIYRLEDVRKVNNKSVTPISQVKVIQLIFKKLKLNFLKIISCTNRFQELKSPISWWMKRRSFS